MMNTSCDLLIKKGESFFKRLTTFPKTKEELTEQTIPFYKNPWKRFALNPFFSSSSAILTLLEKSYHFGNRSLSAIPIMISIGILITSGESYRLENAVITNIFIQTLLLANVLLFDSTPLDAPLFAGAICLGIFSAAYVNKDREYQSIITTIPLLSSEESPLNQSNLSTSSSSTIDIFQNSLYLKKLTIFEQIYCQILRAYAYIWPKNLGIKMPKRSILASEWGFERCLINALDQLELESTQ